MNKTKRFGVTVLVFLLGNVLSKLITFFLLPLYTANLSPAEYGNYDLIVTIVSFVSPLIFFQIWDGMYRFSFDKKKNEEKQAVISNAFVVFGLGTCLYLLISIVFGLISVLGGFMSVSRFFLIIGYAFFYSFSFIFCYGSRVYLKNTLFAISGLANTATVMTLNLILILVCGWGVDALYLGAIAGFIVQILILEIPGGYLRKISLKSTDKELIKKMIRFSIPLCLATASYWLLSGFTKICIVMYLGDEGNGYYAVANRFGSLITLVVTAFQYAWNEIAYIMSEEDDRKEKYSLCINTIIKLLLCLSGCLILGIKIIFPYFIDPSYNAALDIIPATVIGVAFNSLAAFVATIFMSEKNTGFVMISTFIAAIVNIVGGLVVTKFFGLQGALISLGVSFLVLAALRIYQSRKMIGFKLDYKIIFALVSLAACVVVFFLFNNIFILIIGIVVELAVVVILCLKEAKMLFTKKEEPTEAK